METSDSEYFESADEDFNTDSEDESEKSNDFVDQRLNEKIIEPEVYNLKKDKKIIDIPDEPAEKRNLESEIVNVDSQCSKNDIITPTVDNLKCVEKSLTQISLSSDNNKNIEIPEVTAEKITSNVNEKIIDTKELELPITIPAVFLSHEEVQKDHESNACDTELGHVYENKRIDTTDQTNIKLPEGRPIAISNNQNSEKVHPSDNSKEKVNLETQIEHSLWNDDEIDWETEATKEEIERTEVDTAISKNEDSGWDDFDAEWESESPITSETSSGSNNEQVQPKLTTSETQSNKKSAPEVTAKKNLWEDDDWEPLEKPEDKPKQCEEQSGWGGWGSWGVSSLLSTASTLTSHVSQGLSTVLETGIGIPEPEEMARINKLEQNENRLEKNESEDIKHKSDDSPVFGLDGFVSGMSQLTKFVESTGTKVITGGLDTLEAIGKKTVEVLQEGDPGLKKKRAFLKLDSGKPNLSQILREAKERAEEENQSHQQKYTEVKRFKNYEALFDDHQGLVHLEALEMLSKLCSIKLNNLNNSLSGDALKDLHETLEQVKELCELPEDEDEEKITSEDAKEIITKAVKEINIPISYDKLFSTCEEANLWLQNVNLDFIDDTELHQQAIETLAQLTAFAVEQFHKAGELLMVKEHRSTADEADSLVQITSTLKLLIMSQAGMFTDKLSSIKNANKDNISEHITNIFYEAANSGTYIQDALQLLIPVLQVGAV